MHLSFANPAGFWALLGVPAVLAIHLLQRESRQVVTSTWFLFEALAPVSAQGRRLERLRHSLPLWMQLLAVLLLTWLLAGPRWLRRDSTQRVVVVLDSSVSLRAFGDELGKALPARLRALAGGAARTDWRLIETDQARPTLYAGPALGGLLAAAQGWTPHLGSHDFQPALNAANRLAGVAGIALFVTDRPADLPPGVKLLAVGRALDNAGWAGVTVDDAGWHAMLKNYSAAPQSRAWRIDAGGVRGPEAALTLEPGQVRTLSGSFPPGQDRCELVLDADEFPLDDRLPIIRPQPKRLTLAVPAGGPFDDFLRRLAGSVPHADAVAGKADATLSAYGPSAGHAVLLAAPEKELPDYLNGEIVAENHPLTAGLTWNSLICRRTDPIPAQEGDEALLWQGERPLIFLRGGRADRSLIVNFDLRQSNADRLPAFVVLLNRFLESIRAEKVAPERLNVETNQPLDLARDPALPPPRASNGDSPLRAPAAPGFFEVTQGEHPLLTAAAHFSDAREADFRDAAAADTLEGERARLVERNSRQDVLWPVFALLLAGACLGNWAATGGGK